MVRSPALRFGISPALVTPFRPDGAVDLDRLAAHADDCLVRGCRSVTLFGTTGEGPSIGATERDRVAAELVHRGLRPSSLVEGVIACSVEEAAFGTARALERGAAAVLLAPPFYFRDAPDETLFAWFAEVFRRVGPALRDIILYHIPGMTGVPLSDDAVARLKQTFPGAITGVKDSAGDARATLDRIDAHRELMILVGDESYLGRACAAGAAGSISGLANLAPEAMARVAESGRDDPRVAELVTAVVAHPVVPMVKALLARRRDDRAWALARPPLPTLDDDVTRDVVPLVNRLADGAEFRPGSG
jgi:4-hydroxy-tetrahydrodipicolinate synthase